MNRRSVLKYASLSAFAAAISDISARDGLADAAVLSPQEPMSQNHRPYDAFAFNQIGFLPNGDKVATVHLRDESDKSFQIVRASDFKVAEGATGKVEPVAYRGSFTASFLDEASGDHVSRADFSSFTVPGTYCLVSQGERGQPFVIGNGVYRDALRLSMRAFYGQRCGCVVDLGGGYRHSACHLSGAYHPSSGRQGIVASNKGWHDAGDYGRYVVNSGIATGTLLWAWELYPESLKALSLDIPESVTQYGAHIPDFLAEVRWNLEWMLSLQDADGGVWHKQTSEHFCGFVMPEKDELVSYVIGTGEAPFKSTCATADLAAVMAIAARCYAEFDAAFSARCLTAAERGWHWAVAHPNVPFTNPAGVSTGPYDDSHCLDEILWASAELWRTTGKQEFQATFVDGVSELPPETNMKEPSWDKVTPLAYWTFAMTDQTGSGQAQSAQIKSRIKKETARSADTLITRSNLSGYGNTLALDDYTWGSNGVAANQSLLLLMANHFEPDRQLVEAALSNLHYLLGRNCFGVSWVTQLGTNPFEHPHHRPSVADGISAPWPGLLSGGPNARPADDFARTLPKLPPMRMWVDEAKAYSLNEVAINWNAPLVFLLAAVNAQSTWKRA